MRPRSTTRNHNIAVQTVVVDLHRARVHRAVVPMVHLMNTRVPKVRAVSVAPYVEADLNGLSGGSDECEGNSKQVEIYDM